MFIFRFGRKSRKHTGYVPTARWYAARQKVQDNLYTPTEDEIAAATAEIRKGWDENETYRRNNYKIQPIEFVECSDPAKQRNGYYPKSINS
jgi:hypothetical protein